jgi:hypothetical protein
MATITQRLAFLISANADGAIKAFDKTAQQADKQLGKAQKSIDQLGVKMTRFGATGLAAAGTLGAGLFKLAQGAIEDQKAQALLAEQLRSSTGATEAQIAAVEKSIDAMARATGVADDQLRPAFATLVRATGDVSKAQQLLQTSMDISAATGRDLSAVTIAMGRAANGQIGALSRLGIPLDENVKKSKDFDAALQALNTQFGGAAATAADTYAGKMARAQVSIGEAGEALGTAFVPVIEQATQLITSGIGAFDSFNRTTDGLAGKLLTVGTVGLGAISTLSLIGGQAIKLRDAFFVLDSETKKMTRSLTALGKMSLISTAAIGGAVVVYQAYANKKKEVEERTRSLTEALKLEGEAQQQALKDVVAADETLLGYAKNLTNLGLTFDDLEAAANGNSEAFANIRKEYDLYVKRGQFTTDRARQLGDAIGYQGEMTVGVANQIGDLIGEVDRLSQANLTAAESAKLAGDAIGALTGEEKSATEVTKEKIKQYFGRLRIERQITEGQKKMAEETAKSSKKTKEDTEASRKNTEAKQKFAAKVNEAAEAVRDQLNTALDNAKQKLKDVTDDYNSYVSTVSQAITGTINLSDAQRTATSNAEALAEATREQVEAQNAYADALASADPDAIATAFERLTKANARLNTEASKPQGFLAVLRKQAGAAETFAGNIQKLLDAGLDQAAIDQIIGSGAEAGNAIAESLLGGVDPAANIDEVNKLIKSTQKLADTLAKATADKFKKAGVDQATSLLQGVQSVFDTWYPMLSDENIKGVVDPLKTISGWAATIEAQLAAIGSTPAPSTPVAVTSPMAGDWAGLTADEVRGIASWLGGFPGLADGGIVRARNGGTLVRVGEGGRDEAVIPLPSNMGGQTVNVTINVNGGDPNAVVDALKRYVRTNGALPNVIKVSQ